MAKRAKRGKRICQPILKSEKGPEKRVDVGRNCRSSAYSLCALIIMFCVILSRECLAIAVGDYVRVDANVAARTGAGTANSEISSPYYSAISTGGYGVNPGTVGLVTAGPTSADGYTWWQDHLGAESNLVQRLVCGKLRGDDSAGKREHRSAAVWRRRIFQSGNNQLATGVQLGSCVRICAGH